MPPALLEAFDAEMTAARTPGPTARRWRAVERAHILSQLYPWPHTRTHGVMFRLALRDRDVWEMLGQVVRLVVSAPDSADEMATVGRTPRPRLPRPVRRGDGGRGGADGGEQLGGAERVLLQKLVGGGCLHGRDVLAVEKNGLLAALLLAAPVLRVGLQRADGTGRAGVGPPAPPPTAG
ncbi:DUF3703 domain-containing protein [Kitasatospora sp. NPDC054795]